MEAKYIAWRNAYIRSSPEGLYCFYNASGDNGDAVTCSEAHGYAMLISILHRNLQDFDALLRFFLHFRNEKGLMKWQVRQKKHHALYVAEDGQTSATDGDIDIAAALILASRLFPQGSPAYPAGAYRHEAQALLSAIYRYEIHPDLRTPLLGDWCNSDGDDNVRLYNATRSSDFILSAFHLFEQFVDDAGQKQAWRSVVDAVVGATVSVSSQSETGLVPDFLEYNAQERTWKPAWGKLLEGEYDGHVSWNACRTPWRLAHYYAVTQDARLRPVLDKMYKSLVSPDHRECDFPQTPAGIDIWSGKPLVDYSDKAFIAPTSYLCYVLGDSASHKQGVDALAAAKDSYFGDSIDVLIAEQAVNAELFR
ncbi:uncharacterized protein PFL1_02713 [Pseudozyma flocculosa PF-1]|uniref:Related to Endoglucanase n=2 Tax=Pseudozyma flocculosa TaxID=84751 RepID=A0A5C3F0S3_9BASI|nr:uncharacterized protein PFL1_02713 [Pseudozyma flocculosa PF-1]EPQ29494.1 hypothetical protein PFL1_02713 [Pseudozyma flocculosa PF-1]SPO38028.1 related to Endoglucanase [Pseudozyma flocculosa]